MSYNEYLPHPALQSYIDAYWTVRISKGGKPYEHRVLPDCCADIIFHQGESILVGTMTTFKDTIQLPDSFSIGIRFKPGAISAFYSLNLQEVTNLAVPYQDKPLAEIVNRGGKDVLRKLDYYFLNKLNTKYPPIAAVMNDISAYKGQVSVTDLISRHAMSERKLERLFKQHAGVSIKGMIKLVRFTHVLSAIRNKSSTNLTAIAYAAGYYDQAHLCNEIKAYTGLTPAQL